MYGGIVYGLIGLVPEVSTFWKFILVLVLFNLTTASVILLLSIAFASTSVASLVGTLIMLFKYVWLFEVMSPLLMLFEAYCLLGCSSTDRHWGSNGSGSTLSLSSMQPTRRSLSTSSDTCN